MSASATLLTTKEAARIAGYSSDYVGRLAKSGELPAKRVGRSWAISNRDLQAFLSKQMTRKEELSQKIAEEREVEYQKAQQKRVQTKKQASGVSQTSFANTVSSPLRMVRTTTISSHFRMVVSTGVTAAILAGGVLFVESGVGDAMGSSLLSGALSSRAQLATASQALYFEAATATQAHKNIARTVFGGTQTALDSVILSAAIAQAKTESQTMLHVWSESTYAKSILATHIPVSNAHAKISFNDVATYLTNPYAIGASLAQGHKALGEALYREIESVQYLYMAFVQSTANTVVATSLATRDAVMSAPDTIGMPFVYAAHSIIDGYTRAMYAYVGSVERVPEAIVGSLIVFGDVTGSTVASIVHNAPTVYQNVLMAYVQGAAHIGQGIEEYAFNVGHVTTQSVASARGQFDSRVANGLAVLQEQTQQFPSSQALANVFSIFSCEQRATCIGGF